MYKIRYLSILIIIIMLQVNTFGCKQKNEDSEKKDESKKDESQEKKDSEEKPPEELKDIDLIIEKTIVLLKGPTSLSEEESKKIEEQAKEEMQEEEKDTSAEDDKKSEEKKEGEDSEKKDSEDEKSEDEKSKDEEKDASKEKSEEETKKEEEKKKWKMVNKALVELHQKWNALIPAITKKGIDEALVDDFNHTLNLLTDYAVLNDKNNYLLYANMLYAYIPKISKPYKQVIPADLTILKYYTRNIILNAQYKNWEQVNVDLEEIHDYLDKSISYLHEIEKENKEKLDYSVTDFESVAKEKNVPLIQIKGKIIFDNINEIVKVLEEKQKKKEEEEEKKK